MIFNLFKSKPTLKELIPKGFTDIHSHILPGIDDGAKNIKESKILIDGMENIGFSKIIGTPHIFEGIYNNNNKSIKNAFEELKINLDSKINIEYASEYMLDDTIIKKARNNDLLCLKDNHVLVEMSYFSEPLNLFDIIYEIKVNGYKPILAHPERYTFLHNNLKKYIKLKKFGCYFQINLLSVTGHYGKNTLNVADNLLRKNLIDFAGSDIHKISHLEGFNHKVKIKNVEKLKKAMHANNIF